MQFVTEFFTTFLSSRWVSPLDYLMAFAAVAGCYVYVYIINPRPVKAPSQFAPAWEHRMPLNNQDSRFVFMALAITLVYVVLRVLNVMGLV